MTENDFQRKESRSFVTTQWSLVVAAGQQSSPDSKRALESLCQIYWVPLYSYVRRRVNDCNQAQDLTQAFFAELLEKNYVRSADKDRGMFRSFLLTALKNYLSKQWEKEKAQKRGGGRSPLSLDFETADSNLRIEPSSGLTPEQEFDRQWAITLLDNILQRLKSEYQQASKEEHFEELKGFVIGDPSGQTYQSAASNLNITESAARKAVSRIRKRYRELLREEIAQTVSDENTVDEEIQSLFSTLRSS